MTIFISLVRTLWIVSFVSLLALTASAETPLQEGTWTAQNSAINGGWSIVQENGRHYVVLDEAFSTKRAPDLKLFLSPLPLEELGDRNATKRAVLVSKLDSHKGTQRYVIPSEVNLVEYRSLIIHCEQYSKLWGGADLDVRN